MDFPRIALLTWCSPDSRYAGGAAVRRLLERLPPAHLRWCGFHAGAAPPGLPAYRAFAPRALHWRLRGTWLEHAAVDAFQARRLAAAMWAWIKPFDPHVLWVFPEVWAVSVGLALQRLSGLPLHVTVHDAPESAGFGAIPRSYLATYCRHMQDLLSEAHSADAVSTALIAHLRRSGGLRADCETLVLPPCVNADTLQPAHGPNWSGERDRRIGLCGSFRQSAAQWDAFLRVLAALPYRFTLVSFTPPEELPAAPLPSNVTLEPQPYAPTERDVIRSLAATDACYLGLWTEPARRLFGETSVSSKLTSYAAAARPIIVDATEHSVAWQLVSAYGAGVRVGDQPARVVANGLNALFSDAEAWRRMATGARRLCEEVFSLEPNVERLRALLERTACAGQPVTAGAIR